MTTKIKIETPEEKNKEYFEEVFDGAHRECDDEPDPEMIEEEPEDELAKAQKEAQANYDRFLRLSAEFENYKKRMAKDKEDFYKYANESFIKTLLPVIDYLEMGLEAARKSENADAGLAQGFELMGSEFYKVLEKAQVEILAPNPGDEFDPAFQEAVMQEETDEFPSNRVVRIYQKGYKLYDHLLRPARVITSIAKS